MRAEIDNVRPGQDGLENVGELEEEADREEKAGFEEGKSAGETPSTSSFVGVWSKRKKET